MVAALWMPFMLGRIVVPTILSWREVLAESWLWRWAAPACSALLGADLGRGVAQGPAAASAGNAGAAGPEVWEGMGSKVALLPLVQRVSQQLEVHLSGPGLNDWVCLGVGYSESLLRTTRKLPLDESLLEASERPFSCSRPLSLGRSGLHVAGGLEAAVERQREGGAARAHGHPSGGPG